MSAKEGPAATTSFGAGLRHASIYSLGTVGVRIGGLFLVPLYTYNLTPAEYGIMEYLDLISVFISMLFSLGLASAIYRFYYGAEDEPGRRTVVATTFITMLLVAAAVAGVMLLLAPWIADRFFRDPVFHTYLTILFVGFAFNAVGEFGMTYVSVMQRSKLYSTIKIARFLVDVGLNVWFLIGLRWGVQGLLISNLITHVGLALFLWIAYIRPQGLHFSWDLLRRMVRYGVPLALVQICLFVINFTDRFFLQAYGDFTQVGIYALAYKFGIMMNTLVVANFFQIWQAKSFEVAGAPNAHDFYRRVFTYLIYGLFGAGLVISVLAQDLIALVAPPEYGGGAVLVPLVVLAYLLHGMGTYFELGLKLRDRTKILGFILVGTCVLCLGLYALLIPRLGMLGAVLATDIAFLVRAVLVYIAAQRIYPLRFEFGRTAVVALVTAAAMGARFLLPDLPLPLSIAAGVGILAAYGVAMVGWVLRPEERADAFAFVRRLAPRRAPTGSSGG
ncbi:MAG TPA: oligosaccharide flippase family protein [Acidobacteriota bacterium]|nr:oligosaccharide flippase family protein [Acidobacteriota bacterium]